LRPVFNNVRSLADITGLPVLGVVSMTFVDRNRVESRLRKLAFGGAGAALMLIFACTILFQGAGVRLMQRLLG
jgi:hypothetical protein